MIRLINTKSFSDWKHHETKDGKLTTQRGEELEQIRKQALLLLLHLLFLLLQFFSIFLIPLVRFFGSFTAHIQLFWKQSSLFESLLRYNVTFDKENLIRQDWPQVHKWCWSPCNTGRYYVTLERHLVIMGKSPTWKLRIFSVFSRILNQVKRLRCCVHFHPGCWVKYLALSRKRTNYK